MLDATGTDERGAASRISRGAQRAAILAADHPERVAGVAFICPAASLAPGHPDRDAVTRFDDELDTDEGWAKYNRHYWHGDYRGFVEFFFAQCFPEPHSTKQIEDCVGWALETTPETLADTTRGARHAAQRGRWRRCASG